MIEVRPSKQTGRGEASAGVLEVVLSASPAINNAFQRLRKSDPVRADLLRLEFVDAVAEFLKLIAEQDIHLVPADYDPEGHLMASVLGRYGILPAPPVGVVRVNDTGLSMVMVGNCEGAERIVCRKELMDAAFGLIMTARFFRFASKVSCS